MVHPLAKKRFSLSPHPVDNRAEKDTVSYLKGEKKTLSETNYTQAAYTSKRRCSECVFYESPGEKDSSCKKVVGVVSADGMCDLFKEGHAPVGDSATTISITIANA